MSELYGVTFTMLIIDISFLLIGFFIKKTKSAELISGFDINKDNDNKEFLAQLFGNGILLMGIISTMLTVAFFIMTRNATLDTVKSNALICILTMVLSIVFISGRLYYLMYRKRNKK